MSDKKDQPMNEDIIAEQSSEEAVESTSNKPTESMASSNSAELTVSAKLTAAELATLDYTDFDTPARMLELGRVLCKSQLVPLKKPEDVVVALMTGRELGLGFITSISQIYPINGRGTLGVHLQKALCLKHGIIIEKIEDCVSIYLFAKADDTGKTILQADNKPLLVGKGTLEEQPPSTTRSEIDKRTTYKLTRELRMPSGKFHTVSATGSFSMSEAREADLLDKEVWIKYWRRMLDARAFTNAVGEIADDITLGLRAPNEVSSEFYVNSSNEEVPYIQVD